MEPQKAIMSIRKGKYVDKYKRLVFVFKFFKIFQIIYNKTLSYVECKVLNAIHMTSLHNERRAHLSYSKFTINFM